MLQRERRVRNLRLATTEYEMRILGTCSLLTMPGFRTCPRFRNCRHHYMHEHRRPARRNIQVDPTGETNLSMLRQPLSQPHSRVSVITKSSTKRVIQVDRDRYRSLSPKGRRVGHQVEKKGNGEFCGGLPTNWMARTCLNISDTESQTLIY
jgi:hypothetical protein